MHRQAAGVERIDCRHAIDHDQATDIKLQLHQQLVAECLDQVGRIRGAADMANLDPAARRRAERGVDRLGVEARQLVFDRAQCFQHLPGQKLLGAPLRFGNRQHSLLRPTPAQQNQLVIAGSPRARHYMPAHTDGA